MTPPSHPGVDRSRSRGMVGRITLREFTTTVRRPGWIFSTLLLPLLPLLGLLADGLLDPARIIGGPDAARVAIVDEAKVLDPAAFEPPDALASPPPTLTEATATDDARLPDRFFLFEEQARAREALLDPKQTLSAMAILPADYLAQGEILVVRVASARGPSQQGAIGLNLRRALRRGLLSGRLPPEVERRVLEGTAKIEEQLITADGAPLPPPPLNETVRRFVLPLVAAMLLAMAIFAGAGYLLLGLSEEKENRILELLLASVTPEELLAGKLLGIGGAGLLQFSLWILVMLAPATAILPYLSIDPVTIAWGVAYFLAGYLFFGALMLGAGTVADTARHAQQLSGIFTLVAVSPLLGSIFILQAPDSTWARVLTLFPLTAPLTAMMRLPVTRIPTWELGLSLGLLLACGAGAVWISARLLRSALWSRFNLLAALARGVGLS